jgi:FtsP/CotA-like multicopper oxidase with cupredoxin domain
MRSCTDYSRAADTGWAACRDAGRRSAAAPRPGHRDVDYPLYPPNGRIPTAPHAIRVRPGQQVRLRLINAGSDNTFRVGIGGHRMIVTHSDGFPVRPVNLDALLIAMGERYDAMVTLGDGIFPLVASADLPLDHQRPHLR